MNKDRLATMRRGVFYSACCAFLGAIGCRDTAAPPNVPRDLGTKESPLLPLNSPWTDRAIRDGQAEWVPFRAPGTVRKPSHDQGEGEAAAEASAETGTAPAGNAEVAGLVEEYNKAAAEFSVDEMVKYFVEAQEPQLRAAYEKLGVAREALSKTKDRLLQLEGADAEGIQSAFDNVTQFTSGALQIKDAHGHEDQKVHITFESGSFLAGGFALLDGKDWYLEVAALPDVDGIKGVLDPFVEQVRKLGEGEPAAPDVLAALAALELPPLGSAEEPDAAPEKEADPEAGANAPEGEKETE